MILKCRIGPEKPPLVHNSYTADPTRHSVTGYWMTALGGLSGSAHTFGGNVSGLYQRWGRDHPNKQTGCRVIRCPSAWLFVWRGLFDGVPNLDRGAPRRPHFGSAVSGTGGERSHENRA